MSRFHRRSSGSRFFGRMCLISLAATAASCAEPLAPAPAAEGVSLLQGGPGTFNVSGPWSWSRTESIRMPEWFVLGVLNSLPQNNVVPEGPNTLATCDAGGTMLLAQVGTSVTGVAAVLSSSCVTQGGQAFTQPGAGLPLTVTDGRLSGQALQFDLANLTVAPCPMVAAITEYSGDVATALSGTGRCVLPGHPQSESIVVIDPPSGGTSKTVQFDAWR